jgi:hypothetical protein
MGPLPETLAKLWNNWNSELPVLVETERSLAVYQEQIEAIQLHSFGDAPER